MESQQVSLQLQHAIFEPNGLLNANMTEEANQLCRCILNGIMWLIALLRQILGVFVVKTKKVPDYYSVLGVSRNATQVEIKHARDRLARQYHPDRNPQQDESEEKIKLINEAYNILSDPVFRNWYDYLGSMGVQFRIGWANRWEAAKERVAEKATKSMHYAPLSKTMACFGLEKEYQELGQTIREERRIPGEEFPHSLESRGYGFILRAVQAYRNNNFHCAKCKEKIVGLDGLCYCRETADIGPHCRNNKCCPNCKMGHWEKITLRIGNWLNQVNEFLRG